ncbi:MAG: zf-TFIIB domain-containing protein [Elainellaceae cyanobacterium]
MQCPKDREIELVDSWLSDQLAVQECPKCQGNWIPSTEYQKWRGEPPDMIEVPQQMLSIQCESPPNDTKGALCPACGCFLSRAKVALRTPFYVERCSNCGGIWCDRGEWDILEMLGLHVAIEQLFSSDWQSRVKEVELANRERQATIDKLGEELALRVFELAELLEQHPNGDFGVAYLMRRFEE